MMSTRSLLLALCFATLCVGAFSAELALEASSSKILVEGRTAVMGDTDGSYLAFDWSGISLKVVVSNTTTASVVMADTNAYYNVFLDHEQTPVHVFHCTDYEPVTYSLLPEGTTLLREREYLVTVTRRTEAQNNMAGPAKVYRFLFDVYANISQMPFAPSSRRLEFLGDSITCGYGILANSTGCNGQNPQGVVEDNWLTYDQLLARAFDAAVHVESWSGIGLVRNYGAPNTTSADPFPSYWNRTIAVLPSPVYDFSLFVPDAVVINLGTNDFSTQPQPSREQFESAYVQFIATVRAAYAAPSLPVFLACGPMTDQPCCTYVQSVVRQVPDTHYVDLVGLLGDGLYGCGGHPNVQGHRKMAAYAQPTIASVMGW